MFSLFVIPSSSICRSIDLPPLTLRFVDHMTWRHRRGTANDLSWTRLTVVLSFLPIVSDVAELLQCEAPESIGQLFTGIQPWHFEPPGRSSEADEVRESPENIEPAYHSPAAISKVKNSKEWWVPSWCRTIGLLWTTRSAYRLISSMLWMIQIVKWKGLIKHAFFFVNWAFIIDILDTRNDNLSKLPQYRFFFIISG